MKIDILLPLHTNYEGIPQAYTLQTVLEHVEKFILLKKSPQFPIYSE